mgnify:CR=1 FL=1
MIHSKVVREREDLTQYQGIYVSMNELVALRGADLKLDLKGNYDTGRNKLTLNSSFDEQVKKALEDAVNKEIAKVKAQIQDEINKQLAPVLSQFEGLKAEDLAKLETWEKGLESQLDEYQNKAEKKYKKQEKKVKKKLQKEADKALEGVGDDIKNALKGLKF